MQQSQAPMPAITLWIIWFAILTGLFILQTFIVGGFHTGPASSPVSSGMVAICMSGIIIASFIRWFILPRQSSLAAQLPVMIIGLAFAELTGLLSMFLIGKAYPSMQLLGFILSVLAILQFMPVYAKTK